MTTRRGALFLAATAAVLLLVTTRRGGPTATDLAPPPQAGETAAGTSPMAPPSPAAAEPTASPSGALILGLALDEDGAPVAGASVWAEHGDQSIGLVTTDRAGRFRLADLDPGEWEVCAQIPGCTLSHAVVLTSREEVTEVRLVGLPVRDDLLVEITFSEPPGGAPGLRVGPRGRWGDLPPDGGIARLVVDDGPGEVEAACPGFRSARASWPGPRPPPEPILLHLEAGGGLPRAILVVDRDGRPVPDALVFRFRGEEDHYPRAASTGPDGRFAVELGMGGLLVQASAPAGASRRVPVEEGADEIVLALEPAATLGGRVLDRDSRAPIAGARVDLVAGDCPCCAQWAARTDAEGQYRFEGIPPGLYVTPVVASAPGWDRTWCPASREEALARGRAHVAAGAGTTSFDDLLVARQPTWTRRFILDHAEPGERVRIDHLLDDGTEEAVLGPEREVVREFRAGPVLLRFRGHGGWAYALLRAGTAPPSPDLTVCLAPPPRVVVQLVDESGAPWKPEDRIRVVAKSRLRSGAESLPVERNTVEVDAAGRAEVSDALVADDIDGIENTVLVIEDDWLAGPLHVLASDLAAAARAGGGEAVLTLPIRRRAVRGGVLILAVDAEGRPVPGVRIGVRELLGEHDDAEMAVTDEAGRATVKPSWEPLLPWWGDWYLNDDDPEKPQRVVVETGRLVRFRVTDESGAPLPETVVSDAGGLFYDWTDEAGCADVALPARVRTLDLENGEWWFGRVTVPPGDTEVVLQGLAQRDVRVAVRGAEGFRGDDGLQVEWSAAEAGGTAASDGTQAVRDGEGWAATLRLPPLPVRVRAYSSNLRWQARAVVAPGAAAIDLALAPPPEQEVVLRLIDEAGRPLGDRPVETDGSAFATDALLPPDARTDAEGRLVLRLPEGPHLFRRLQIGDLEVRDLRFTAPSPAPVEARLGRR